MEKQLDLFVGIQENTPPKSKYANIQIRCILQSMLDAMI